MESARRARDNGALTSAEATARRAVRLAAGDPEATFDADEVLVHVLLAAGKPGEALALGHDLAARLARAGVPAARQADLLIVTARAALAAGDGPGATRHAAAAREAAGDAVDPALAARLDGLAAEVALDQADLERGGAARRRGGRRRRRHRPARGRVRGPVRGRARGPRREGMEAALPSYEQAAEVAAEHGLAQLHLRAQQEPALVVWTRGDLQPLFEVRDLAARYGAHITVAAMDLSLADIALSTFDRDACLAAATSCAEASRRYGLATEPVAHLWLAGAHALRGRSDRACRRPSMRRSPTTPTTRGSSPTSTAGC